jgi:hypothetical protein
MATYTPIASVTLNSTTSSYTFTNIPQNYTDLIVVGQVLSTQAAATDVGQMQFNGDTSTNYSATYVRGPGGTVAATSSRSSNVGYIYCGEWPAASTTTTTYSLFKINISNYANTSVYKSVLLESGSPSNYMDMGGGLWRSLSAINSIKIFPTSGSFAAGTTLSIYGIQSGGTSKASGGDIVKSDGSYWYHVFLKSGVFIPTVAIPGADILVVGGGGSGAYYGGGGAGGVQILSQNLTTQTYPCTVAAGSALFTAIGIGKGNPSQFGALTPSYGGGYAGYSGITADPYMNGGSGGGNGQDVSQYGTGVSGQGNNGGNGGLGGGGGGAGGAGNASPSYRVGGNGGIGKTSTIITAMGAATGFGQLSGGNYYFGGGGGGGSGESRGTSSGGLGGGANGGPNNSTTATTPTAYTGGGGGGCGTQSGVGNSSPSAGASGIIIVRYPV